MKIPNFVYRIVGAFVFIGGGFIGGSTRNVDSFLLRIILVAIAFTVCAIGIMIWKAANEDDPETESSGK